MISLYKKLLHCLLMILLSGCVSMEEFQNGMNEIDSSWGGINARILAAHGRKTYSTSISECIEAARNTATQLGFSIIKEDSHSVIAQALTPAPFTKDEYKAIKNIEEPIMQAMAAHHVGKFYSRIFYLDEKGFFYITATINVTNTEKDGYSLVQIDFSIEPKKEQKYFIYGKNPPPEAVRKGLEKWWITFDNNLQTN